MVKLADKEDPWNAVWSGPSLSIYSSAFCMVWFIYNLFTFIISEQIQQMTIRRYLSYFSRKIVFDLSCTLPPVEAMCMKGQSLFSRKNYKNISKWCLLKFLPSMLSVKLLLQLQRGWYLCRHFRLFLHKHILWVLTGIGYTRTFVFCCFDCVGVNDPCGSVCVISLRKREKW